VWRTDEVSLALWALRLPLEAAAEITAHAIPEAVAGCPRIFSRMSFPPGPAGDHDRAGGGPRRATIG
jgi:hypothetical protein